MEYLIGLAVALGVAALAAVVGFDRDRSFAPTVLIVIAAYYVLFAAMGGSHRALVFEILAASGFLALAVIGFKMSPLLIAAAIAGHGMFDLIHHFLIDDPGVPNWWPGFCMAADVGLGGWFAALQVWRKNPSRPAIAPLH